MESLSENPHAVKENYLSINTNTSAAFTETTRNLILETEKLERIIQELKSISASKEILPQCYSLYQNYNEQIREIIKNAPDPELFIFDMEGNELWHGHISLEILEFYSLEKIDNPQKLSGKFFENERIFHIVSKEEDNLIPPHEMTCALKYAIQLNKYASGAPISISIDINMKSSYPPTIRDLKKDYDVIYDNLKIQYYLSVMDYQFYTFTIQGCNSRFPPSVQRKLLNYIPKPAILKRSLVGRYIPLDATLKKDIPFSKITLRKID